MICNLLKSALYGGLFLSLMFGLQGCCYNYGYDGTHYYEYEQSKYFKFYDSTEVFTRVSYDVSSKVEYPNANKIQWEISLLNPITTIYFESNKKKDTLVYSMKTSQITYNENTCSQRFETVVTGPTILSSSFDSIYVQEKDTIIHYYKEITQHLYILK